MDQCTELSASGRDPDQMQGVDIPVARGEAPPHLSQEGTACLPIATQRHYVPAPRKVLDKDASDTRGRLGDKEDRGA